MAAFLAVATRVTDIMLAVGSSAAANMNMGSPEQRFTFPIDVLLNRGRYFQRR
jgi:hypothetical protein